MRAAFYERVLTRGGELAHVQEMAFTTAWPPQQAVTRNAGGEGASFQTRAGYVGVSPAYFDVLRIPLHAGRTFDVTDRIGSPPSRS